MDRSLYRCLLLLTCFLPLLVSPWGYDNAILVKESLLLLLAGGLLVFLFLRWAGRGGFSPRVNPVERPALCLGGLAVLSLASATNLPAALSRLILWLAGISLLPVALRAPMDPRRIETLARAAVATAVLVAAYGVVQYLHLDPFGRTEPFSTLSNPNYTAEFLASVVPICLALAVARREERERSAFGLAALFLFAALLLTRARGAALGVLVGVTLFVALVMRSGRDDLKREVRRLLPLGVAALALLGLFGLFFLSRFAGGGGLGGALEGYGRSLWTQKNVQYRAVFYRDALRMILDNPVLGVGIGNFEFAYPRYRSMPESVDPEQLAADHALNDYLEIGAELGAGGLLALLWLLGAFFRRVFKARSPSPLGVAYACSVAAHAVHSLFASGLYTPVPLAAFWLSMAFSLRLLGDPLPPGGRSEVPAAPGRPPGWALLLAAPAMAGLVWAAAWPLIGDAYLLRGRRLLAGGRVNEAIAALERAGRFAPARTVVQARLAEAYFLVGRRAQAFAVLERYLQYDPYNFRFHYVMGEYLQEGGDPEAALRAYERAVDANRFYSRPLMKMGLIRERRGDIPGAMEAYRQALRRNPAFAEASNSLAVLLARQGRLEEAIGVWEEGAKAVPGDLVIVENLAAAYRRRGDSQKALWWSARAEDIRRKRKP